MSIAPVPLFAPSVVDGSASSLSASPSSARRRGSPRPWRYGMLLAGVLYATTPFAQAVDNAAAAPPSSTVQAAMPSAEAAAPISDADYRAIDASEDARQRALNDRTERMNYTYAVAQHDCYARFFVNHCLVRALDAMRKEKSDIREAQLTLSAERRAVRERKRRQDDAAKRAQAAANAPQRAANEARNRAQFESKQQQHALDLAKRGQDQPQHAANAAAYAQKQAAHQQALDKARADAAADAAKRAENVRRYQAKQDAAAQRQQQLDERRRQAQARAAANASDAHVPGVSAAGTVAGAAAGTAADTAAGRPAASPPPAAGGQ